MTPWEQRSLFQQLAIILSIICVPLLICLLVYAFSFIPIQVLVVIIFITVFPSIFGYMSWQVIIKLKQNQLRNNAGALLSESGKAHPPAKLSLTRKEKVVVGAGAVLPMVLIIYAAENRPIQVLFCWLLLIGIAIVALAGITYAVSKAVLYLCRQRPLFRPIPTQVSIRTVIGKTVKTTCVIVFFIWLLALASPIVSGLLHFVDKPLVFSSIRFPLGSPGGIAVDDYGQIYYRDNFHKRIQVYDKNGDFLRGWIGPVWGNLGAHVQIIIDDNGNLHVDAGYWDTKNPSKKVYRVFSPNGKLLESRSETFSYAKLPTVFERTDSHGNIYKVERFLTPRILKISPSGKTTVLVDDPLYLKLVNFLFPAFAIPLGTGIIAAIWDWRDRKRKPKEDRIAEN